MQVIEIIGLYFDSHAPLLEIAAFLNDLEEGLELQLKVETNIMKNQKEICENITGIIDNMVIILNEDIDKSNRKIIQLEKEFESIKEEKSRLQEEIDEKNKKLAEKELEIIKCNNWRVKYLDFTKNRYFFLIKNKIITYFIKSNEKSFIIKEIQLLLISKPDIFSDYFHSKAF